MDNSRDKLVVYCSKLRYERLHNLPHGLGILVGTLKSYESKDNIKSG